MTLLPGALRALSAALTVGLAVAAIVGGVGSRLAMRAIAATSDPRLRGVLTSDDEPIGDITVGGTIGLVLFVTIAGGIVLGIGYLAARRFLPEDLRVRAVCWAVLTWCLGAAGIFDAEDFDFRFLEPRWLSIAMFSAIFLAAGWISAAGVEVALPRWPAPSRSTWWVCAPFVVLLLVPPVALAVAAVVASSTVAAVRRAWATAAVGVLGSAVLVVGGLWLGAPALLEVGEIL